MKKLFFLSGLFRNDLSIFKNIRKQTVLSVEFRPDPVMRVRIIQISILNSISLLAADIPRQISVLFTDNTLSGYDIFDIKNGQVKRFEYIQIR